MIVTKSKGLKPALIYSLHVVVWLLLFFLNYQFVKNYRIKVDFHFHLMTWLIYAILFYINYIVLIPYLLFKRKFAAYVLFSVCLLFFAGYAKDYNFRQHRKKANPALFEKRIPPPDMPRMNPDRVPPDQMNPDRMPPFPDVKSRGENKFFLIYGLLLIYSLSLSIRFIQKWQDDEKRKSAIEKEKISTELSYLKQQINPHFLFNALNSIYSLTINTSRQASDAILKLSSILRYMLYETENRWVKLTEEINIIRDFIELQKLRLTDKVSVAFQITGESGHFRIPPLLLIPLIENAFKHGADNINDSFIDIRLSIMENRLEVTVVNKVVQNSAEINHNSGIGIKNIRRRLDLLYGDNYTLEIVQKDDVFNVNLQLNLSI